MFNSLQACRAAACLLVVLYHTDSIFNLPKYFGERPFGALFNCGPIALDLLFVLSGFIILHTHRDDLGKPERLGNYLHRRFHRLYPTYWAVLLCVLPVFFLIPSFGDGSQRDLGVVLRSLFLAPIPSGNPIIVVSWSLSLEVLFYLAFGALVLHRGFGLALFAAWAFVLWKAPWNEYPLTFLQNPYFIPILGGMVACEIVHRWKIPEPLRWAWSGGAILLGVSTCDGIGVVIPFNARIALLSGGCMLLLMGLAAEENRARIPVPRFICSLGDASYSVYLVHYPALSVFCKIAKSLSLDAKVPHQLLFVGLSASAIAVGMVFARVVELPLRRWKRPKKPKTAETTPQIQQTRLAA
jgi:peptidoglycan/LPS O-acetylase OafA/YrhL